MVANAALILFVHMSSKVKTGDIFAKKPITKKSQGNHHHKKKLVRALAAADPQSTASNGPSSNWKSFLTRAHHRQQEKRKEPVSPVLQLPADAIPSPLQEKDKAQATAVDEVPVLPLAKIIPPSTDTS